MKKTVTLLILVLSLCSLVLKAQNITVKGKVRDDQNLPAPAVSVKIKNTNSGTLTDVNGNYSISIPGNGVLVISGLGYVTQEINVNGRVNIDVTMKEDNKQLEEVVVIGYGVAKKKDATGAISSVKTEQLEIENPQSVADILKGNIPGLSVGLNTSAKGGGDLLVRGKTTLSAGTSPLIVLDGVIYNGQLSDINPNDIESVDVLKDASSLAVYGAKAATGVVAITTKKGKSDTPTISFNTNFGLATLAKDQKVYDPQGFLDWRADVMRSGSSTPAYLYNDPRNLPDGVSLTDWINKDPNPDPMDIWLNRLGLTGNEKANYLAGRSINWYDDIFRTGARQDHTVSISGRKQEVNYYLSLGYLKNQNLIEGGEFSTARMRLNLEAEAAKFMTIGLNLQYADRDEGSIEADWGQLTNLSPYGDKYNADGSLRRIPTDDNGLNARNPFLNMAYNGQFNKQNTLFGSLYTKVKLPLGITYQLNFSPGLDMYRTFNHNSSENPNVTIPGGEVIRSHETRYNWQIDHLVKWNKTVANIHNFDVTLLANAEKYQTWWTQARNEGFQPSDILGFHNISAGIKAGVNAEDKVYTGDALMARLNYSLLSRYNLTLSVRRDGYSVFGINSKRATFPAAAFGWTFTEESFLKDQAPWLNFGKLRISYGINGNRDLRNPDNGTVDPYAALTQLSIGKYQVVNPANGTPSEVNTVVIGNRIGNKNLQWEETASFNLGLDLGFLKDRITTNIDFYNKKTNNLLVRQSLPNVSGYVNVYSNLAEVNNKGFELSVNSRNITQGNILWRSNLIFSLNRNKIVKLATPNNDIGNGWFIGKDIDVIWDYKIVGVWQQDEAEEAKKYKSQPGDFKLQDLDGNYAYNDNDKQFLGYRTPRFTWALRNEFNIYKNFDFSFQLISNWGQMKSYNQAKNQPGSVGFSRSSSYVLPYWTPENPINDYARLNSGSSGTSYNVYWNNSFVRLNNISVAYNIPTNIVNNLKIKNAKVYFNVNNAGVYAPTWTYWDPQNDGPTPRYYTLGLNVSL